MLPYVLWGGEFNLVNAWFESVSGYTTTGATILNNIEALPHSLLLWRSSTHFLGGIGIVIFMLYILPSVGINRARTDQIVCAADEPGRPGFPSENTARFAHHALAPAGATRASEA